MVKESSEQLEEGPWCQRKFEGELNRLDKGLEEQQRRWPKEKKGKEGLF